VIEFRRGAVQLHILHHAAEREIHGAWMSEELAHHGHEISPGTLYPTLHRMEQHGLLRSRREVVNGRIRRYYAATPAGRDALEAAREALRELADGSARVTASRPRAPGLLAGLPYRRRGTRRRS
jgi:DNA-binding PadR family transcriptional regulator